MDNKEVNQLKHDQAVPKYVLHCAYPKNPEHFWPALLLQTTPTGFCQGVGEMQCATSPHVCPSHNGP